ncbi:MAG: pilus assembly protein TadG-related protein [Planctomycetota bacterium]|nr:pilus assembly protein TadG-related protein [Planctomycetota bacterium]
MLLALLSAVFLILVMCFPLNVGWTLVKRAKLQNAADAAAYSAAVVQADSLSAIAWLNNAQSWCYHRQYELEVKFCVLGVYAWLEKWGDRQISGGSTKPGNEDYDLDGEDWYQDFKQKLGGTPKQKFKEFLTGEEGRLLSRTRNAYNSSDRTLEMWTRTLRIVAEHIAQAMPRMMKYEAMRIAYLNTFDGTVKNDDSNRVYMAFFPDVDTSPVRLNFTPNRNFGSYSGGVAQDHSFMQYEPWDDAKNRFVERAMQMARDMDAFHMDRDTGKLNITDIGDHHIVSDQGKVNMGSIDASSAQVGNKPWYQEYACEPRKIGGKYLAFAKTVICWHRKDKKGTGGHESPDKTPCGHWHNSHTHLHYNCTHIWITTVVAGTYHFHIPIPETHEKGYEDENRWCLHYQCQDTNPPGCNCFGLANINETLNQGLAAAQQAKNVAQAAYNAALNAYNALPDQAHLDALNQANNVLQDALQDLQGIIDAMGVAAQGLGINPIAQTRIDNPGNIFGDYDKEVELAEKKHHAITYCPLCFTDGVRDFPDSDAQNAHSLAYHKLNLISADETDHHFKVPDSEAEEVNGKKKSMVRAYIADLVSPAYANSGAFNGDAQFNPEAAFHQIHRSNYTPEQPAPNPGSNAARIQARLNPTLIFKPVPGSDDHNFFNWGITVALWQRHHSLMIRKRPKNEGHGGIFLEAEGMLAIASAKAGIRVNKDLYGSSGPRTGASQFFPERLICGIGERQRAGESSGPFTAEYMTERFLKPNDRLGPILNLFHSDWGARLIPVDRSVPQRYRSRAAMYVLAMTNRLYRWDGNDKSPAAGPALRDFDPTGLSGADWEKFTELILH